MPLPKLNITIPQEGYSFDDGQSVLRAKLSSGLSRTRLDMLDAPIEADVTLMLDPAQYQYWRLFFRSVIFNGSVPFLLDLVIDTASIEEHEVRLIPGTMQTSVRGTAHIVQFRLEITLNPQDDELDLALLWLYALYGETLPQVLAELEHLPNYDFTHIVP